MSWPLIIPLVRSVHHIYDPLSTLSLLFTHRTISNIFLSLDKIGFKCHTKKNEKQKTKNIALKQGSTRKLNPLTISLILLLWFGGGGLV